MKPKIYVALSTFAKEGLVPLQILENSGYDFVINNTGKRLIKREVISQAKGFDGIVAGLEPYDQEVLEALAGLKCISRCGVGIDNIDLNFAKQKSIAILNTPDVVVQPVAELTVAMIFDLLRKVTFHTELMRQNKWERLTGFQLAGKTIGVIGLGRIGKRVAQILKRLEAKVIAFDIAPDQAWAKNEDVPLLGFHELLRVSDIVTLHMNSAQLCLSAKELAMMKKGALLINTARGSLVDEGALQGFLQNGHLAGAGLDVYTQEPYVGALSYLPNVVLTPHVGTLTCESRLEMEIQAVENVLSFLKKGLL